MRLTAEAVLQDVLVALGEDPLQAMVAPGQQPRLLRMLTRALPGAVRQATLALPMQDLDGWQPLDGEALDTTTAGRATLVLPADLMILGDVRLTSWSRCVSAPLRRDDWRRGLQTGRLPGLKATSTRPLAFMTAIDGARALEMFPARSGDTLAEGWYIPEPAVAADGTIPIPAAAVAETVRLLAASVT